MAYRCVRCLCPPSFAAQASYLKLYYELISVVLEWGNLNLNSQNEYLWKIKIDEYGILIQFKEYPFNDPILIKPFLDESLRIGWKHSDLNFEFDPKEDLVNNLIDILSSNEEIKKYLTLFEENTFDSDY